MYVCPGDHLALSEPADALVTGRILATAIGIQCRTLFGQLPHLIRTYKQRKVIQEIPFGELSFFLHSRKGNCDSLLHRDSLGFFKEEGRRREEGGWVERQARELNILEYIGGLGRREW